MPKGSLAVLIGIGALVVASFGSFYTVQPTEMAGVRRLGTVVTAGPVGPGLHFRVPFIDTVDTIQTSLDTFQLSDLTVYTVDNQAVKVGVGLSSKIPASAGSKLLDGIGRSGNVDLSEDIRPVLADRLLRVFSTQDTVSSSANREQIADEMRRDVGDALDGIFGLQLVDLQLSNIADSPSFQTSGKAAVQVGAAVNSNGVVVSYETAHRWNGQMPSTVLGSSTSPLATLNLPPMST